MSLFPRSLARIQPLIDAICTVAQLLILLPKAFRTAARDDRGFVVAGSDLEGVVLLTDVHPHQQRAHRRRQRPFNTHEESRKERERCTTMASSMLGRNSAACKGSAVCQCGTVYEADDQLCEDTE